MCDCLYVCVYVCSPVSGGNIRGNKTELNRQLFDGADGIGAR